MLPNAVLPPSLDHNYAQWQERENSLAVQSPLMKKIIPAPKPRCPEDPASPQPTHSPVPATIGLYIIFCAVWPLDCNFLEGKD